MNIKVTGEGSLAAAVRRYVPQGDGPYDALWICHDTPILQDGLPDTAGIKETICHDICMHPVIPVLISSQIRVGTIASLEQMFPERDIAYSPENIRVAHAVSDFRYQSRIVVGRRSERNDHLFTELLSPFTPNLIFTDPETAEMVKHTLNCWLGMNIAFINEIQRVCDSVGADANIVSIAMLAERRVSPHAPLRPGAPFGLGHLARDIYSVAAIAQAREIKTPIISSIMESNGVKTK